ncbi:MAG TPA: stage II sporulation protein M [Pyrinomonadaceae bacterium]|nr:stage II sporulation protein M [Pyrinomonadaceae bacterium]
MNRFLDQNKDNWQRLEDLLSMQHGTGLRGLSRMEVREFGELYRRAASDLAIARAETRDPKLINYLNSLVIRAHGRIYRAESQGANLIWKFFAEDFPQTFRRNSRYMMLAFGVFASFVLFGFIATWIDTDFTHFVMLSGITEEINSNNQWWKGLNDANQIGATHILSNNILVTFRVFAMGAFFGIGAFYDLAFEGARLGSVFAACYKLNPPFGNALASFVVGHGVIELSTIFFCGGAGMMIGYAMINPGDLTRSQALKKKGIEAARIVIGCACFLVIAGTIEGFLSPSDMPAIVKIATGVGTGLAMYSYLFFAGRTLSEPPA